MIGVIADDLTGAAEIGALAMRLGQRAEILISGKCGNADVVCVDINSRGCTAAEAARRAASSAALLRMSGAKWIYKKVDSVLRGQVTPEIEAAMDTLRCHRALLVPANPSLGRVIRNGRYFIRGKPIDETEFARDPEHPRRSAEALRMVARPHSHSMHLRATDDPFPEDGIVIGEAATPVDLRHWAARRDSGTLMAGGAEFFGALMRGSMGGARRGSGLRSRRMAGMSTEPANGRELFVCGSTSRSARDFLAKARAARTPVFSLPEELAWGAGFTEAAMDAIAGRAVNAFRSHWRVILNVGLPRVANRSASKQLAVCLVQLAGAILRRVKIGQVYAEGGATAVALVERMGWKRFAVLGELAPGVATLGNEDASSPLLTIKPGSYVWPASVRRGSSIRTRRADCAKVA